MDLKAFLIAIGTDMVALLSGIGSVILLFLEIAVFHKKGLPRWIVLFVAAACFFFASARVWTTEHRALLAEQIANGEPSLSGTIDQDGIAPGRTPDESIVTVIATIRNTGAESIAQNFALKVETASGIIVDGFLLPAPDRNQKIHLAEHDHSDRGIELTRADSLRTNASYAPIPHNGAAGGFEMFYVKVPFEELKQPGWTIKLNFTDIKNHPYSAVHTRTTNDVDISDLSHLQK